MKKNVVKFLSALVLFVVSAPLFADDAVVTFVKGKVEVQKGTAWVALSVGDTVKQSDIISTGIQSEAKIKYNGSLMALGAMTRISLDQLSSGNNKEKVEVNLQTGAVRSKVTHSADTRVSYTVKSPVAVASVRGTDFEMTEAGKVSCFEGAVAVYANKTAAASSDSSSEEAEEEEEEETTEETEAVSEDTTSTEDAAAAETGSEEGSAETTSDAAPADNGPAKPTTNADDIANDAPAAAVVVGANQKTAITKTGNPEKPQDNAQKAATKVKSTVATAASKEAVTTGGATSAAAATTTTSAATTPAATKTPTTGTISVTITFE